MTWTGPQDKVFRDDRTRTDHTFTRQSCSVAGVVLWVERMDQDDWRISVVGAGTRDRALTLPGASPIADARIAAYAALKVFTDELQAALRTVFPLTIPHTPPGRNTDD